MYNPEYELIIVKPDDIKNIVKVVLTIHNREGFRIEGGKLWLSGSSILVVCM